MSMNQQLASIYGTAPQQTQPTEEDVQVLAQAEMLSKVAAANGIDIDQLNDEQILGLANELGFVQTEEEKVAEARVQEADLQGRIMAHAYVDELKKLGAAPAALGLPEQQQQGDSEDESEILEAMAQDRAQNYANQIGVDGVEPVEEMKVSSPVIEKYVEDRAIDILSEAGLI